MKKNKDNKESVKQGCKHLTVSMREYFSRSMRHEFVDGKYTQSLAGEYSDPHDHYEFYCHDCKLKRVFNVRSKRCPQWARDLVAQLLEAESEN